VNGFPFELEQAGDPTGLKRGHVQQRDIRPPRRLMRRSSDPRGSLVKVDFLVAGIPLQLPVEEDAVLFLEKELLEGLVPALQG